MGGERDLSVLPGVHAHLQPPRGSVENNNSLGRQAFVRIAPPSTTSSLMITHTVQLDVDVFNNKSFQVLPPGVSLGVFSLHERHNATYNEHMPMNELHTAICKHRNFPMIINIKKQYI